MFTFLVVENERNSLAILFWPISFGKNHFWLTSFHWKRIGLASYSNILFVKSINSASRKISRFSPCLVISIILGKFLSGYFILINVEGVSGKDAIWLHSFSRLSVLSLLMLHTSILSKSDNIFLYCSFISKRSMYCGISSCAMDLFCWLYCFVFTCVNGWLYGCPHIAPASWSSSTLSAIEMNLSLLNSSINFSSKGMESDTFFCSA